MLKYGSLSLFTENEPYLFKKEETMDILNFSAVEDVYIGDSLLSDLGFRVVNFDQGFIEGLPIQGPVTVEQKKLKNSLFAVDTMVDRPYIMLTLSVAPIEGKLSLALMQRLHRAIGLNYVRIQPVLTYEKPFFYYGRLTSGLTPSYYSNTENGILTLEFATNSSSALQVMFDYRIKPGEPIKIVNDSDSHMIYPNISFTNPDITGYRVDQRNIFTIYWTTVYDTNVVRKATEIFEIDVDLSSAYMSHTYYTYADFLSGTIPFTDDYHPGEDHYDRLYIQRKTKARSDVVVPPHSVVTMVIEPKESLQDLSTWDLRIWAEGLII